MFEWYVEFNSTIDVLYNNGVIYIVDYFKQREWEDNGEE